MATQTAPKEYPRFTAGQRFEHIILIVTFSGLALTGLPQTFANQGWAQTLIDLMGGIESIRIVHRILATLLMAECIYHGGIISYKLYVLGRRAIMIPGLRDARDAVHWIGFNLGIAKQHPHLPRFNFGEKFEYLAVVWGTLIMVITGFMLWNPIATVTYLPGEVIPAARAAHGGEALLAVLSIIAWHMYNVHVKRFNRSMFTGKITHEEMVEEHAEELEALERGEKPVDPPAEIIAKRQRRFWPYATVMTIVLVAGLIWFVTFERTAIATIPRQLSQPNTLVDFSAFTGDAERGAALWQTLECKSCHGENAQGQSESMNVVLAGTEISLNTFVDAVRRGPADMHPFSQEQVSDEQLVDLYTWLRSLGGS